MSFFPLYRAILTINQRQIYDERLIWTNIRNNRAMKIFLANSPKLFKSIFREFYA